MELSKSNDLSGWDCLLRSAPATQYRCAACGFTWRAGHVRGRNRCPNPDCGFIYTLGQLRRLAVDAELTEGQSR
jgi:predicted Zn-ribbon and HTH transcriptional regulator